MASRKVPGNIQAGREYRAIAILYLRPIRPGWRIIVVGNQTILAKDGSDLNSVIEWRIPVKRPQPDGMASGGAAMPPADSDTPATISYL